MSIENPPKSPFKKGGLLCLPLPLGEGWGEGDGSTMLCWSCYDSGLLPNFDTSSAVRAVHLVTGAVAVGLTECRLSNRKNSISIMSYILSFSCR